MRYYVEPTGTGTSTNHWSLGLTGDLVATVAAVLAAPSRGGDEIWAKQGQYNLVTPLVINNNSEPLSIYGSFAGTEQFLCERNANIDSTQYPTFFQNPSILDGVAVNRVIEIQNANVCRIDGFIIQRGRAMTADMGFNGGGVYVNASNNLCFENIVFFNNQAQNFGGGIFTNDWRNVIIKNSIFLRDVATNGGALYLDNAINTLLVNVLFNDNQVDVNGDGAAIYAMGSSNVKIINNTIANNGHSPVGRSSVYCTANANVEIYNSILYPDRLVIVPQANVVVDYCLLNNNPIPPATNPTSGSLILPTPFPPPNNNPNFVNLVSLVGGGDLHLQAGSQCIDNGNTDYIFPLSATDLEGEPRFIDGGISLLIPPFPRPLMEVDMGALEWK